MSVIIIAEAGVNHNGDIRLAKKMIEKAKDAGADYIKFQTFCPEKLVSCLLYTSPSPRDKRQSRMPSSA